MKKYFLMLGLVFGTALFMSNESKAEGVNMPANEPTVYAKAGGDLAKAEVKPDAAVEAEDTVIKPYPGLEIYLVEIKGSGTYIFANVLGNWYYIGML